MWNNINWYAIADVGIIMTCICCYGYVISLRNMLICLILIELAFIGLNIFLISTASFLDDVSGHSLTFFLIALGTSEVAIALGIFVSYSNQFLNIDLFFDNDPENKFLLKKKKK